MKTKTVLESQFTFTFLLIFLSASTFTNSVGQPRGYCQALLQSLPFRSATVTATPGTLETVTSLKGGYDATIGPNPSNPIQFFTLDNGMCPYAARTLIVLNELELDFETVGISMSNGVKPDWYLKINPRGKVPALRVPYHNNEVVYESAICDEYLCDLYNTLQNGKKESSSSSSSSLMPDDPMQRAKIRLLNDRCDTVLNPTFFTYLMNKDTTKDEEMKQKLEEILQSYEDILSGEDSDGTNGGGPYMNGEEFTLADVHMLPFFLRLIVSLRHFRDYHVTKDNFPNLVAWFELCSERASVKSAAKSDEEIIAVYGKFMDANYAFGGLNKNAKK
mmetsp:Transcript_23629/g.29777  ORF Transcript_23629/g.29777 Transcript_23629/m.29777 type:complete len:333 (+) Transcript_23629:110-1108(+)|eukprot:CAMPEP_0203659318 /NCGR_PEP_ID=MMETSP0088-20131115/51477_1 /ASSEMBLY_ACC=CAM_ASM_001087 /TAXON_ID=426623 /ORGANISM="Chaetoceros affinis, Strain CCMP159" /LENGTH=332 /DNA_ID=CAMNT_0050521307 /DNA_START=27 /DNA_END=1025 /DNA_ORIENTATION=-